MFDLSEISPDSTSLVCSAKLKNSRCAEEIRAAFIGPVRQINMFSDLYCVKERLFLEAPDRETLLKTADILNHSVEWENL